MKGLFVAALALFVLRTVAYRPWPSDDDGYFAPTTCSGAIWVPPLDQNTNDGITTYVTRGGTYNLSIWDPCTKSVQSVFVDVTCPTTIPAANFTLVMSQSGYPLVLEGSVCTDPDLEIDVASSWHLTRWPGKQHWQKEDYIGHGFSLNYNYNYGTGVYQFLWKTYDGCNMYLYNTTVHWDGNQATILPDRPGNQYDTYNSQCAGDRPKLSFDDEGTGTCVFGVEFNEDEGERKGQGSQNQYHRFGPTYTWLRGSLDETEGGATASRTYSNYEWQLSSPDHVLLYHDSSSGCGDSYDYWGNCQRFHFIERAWFYQQGNEKYLAWLPLLEKGVYPLNSTQLADYSYTDDGWDTKSYPVKSNYPQNRANATFNTEVPFSSPGNFNFKELYTYTYTEGTESVYADLDTQPWNSAPICTLELYIQNELGAMVQPYPWQNDYATPTGAFNVFKHCVGSYNLSVTATTNDTCPVTASTLISVVCGFAPEVRLSPDNQRNVAWNYGYYPENSVTLSADVRNPFGGSLDGNSNDLPYVYSWNVIEGPAGAYLNNDAMTSATFYFLLPGIYKINFTVSDGCQSVSVVETVTVWCSETAVPTGGTFDDIATSNVRIYNGHSYIEEPLSISGATTTANGASVYQEFELVSLDTAPGIVRQAIDDGLPYMDDNWLETNGAGSYSLKAYADQGCGQKQTLTKTYTLKCFDTADAPGTFVVKDFTQTYSHPAADGPGYSIDIEHHADNAFTPPANYGSYTLHHTFVLKSYNGKAADSLVWYTQNSGDMDFNYPFDDMPYVSLGTYVYDYYVDDGCQQKKATYTLQVTCAPTTTLAITVSDTPVNNTAGATFKLTYTETDHNVQCRWTFTHSSGRTFDVNNGACQTSLVSFPLAGGWSATAFASTGCGWKGSATTSFTVSCSGDQLSANVVIQAREGSNAAASTTTFTNGRFPSLVINATGSTMGTLYNNMLVKDDWRGGKSFSVWLLSAPKLSRYITHDREDSEADDDNDDEGVPGTEDMDGDAALRYYREVKYNYLEQSAFQYTDLPTTTNAAGVLSEFTPDVAGVYTVQVRLSGFCGEFVQTYNITANCPDGESSAVIADAKGATLATSAGYAAGTIPGVSVTITSAGNELLGLDGSKSIISGSNNTKTLFYHWHWEAPYDKDEYDHSGITTPFSPVLWLDPKLYMFNNRPLLLTVSDGCSSQTTAVRVNSVCSGASITVKADKSTLKFNKTISPWCGGSVKLYAGGLCINHKQWMQTVVASSTNGALLTSSETFTSTFTTSTVKNASARTMATTPVLLALMMALVCWLSL